jgi:hypothetical protein
LSCSLALLPFSASTLSFAPFFLFLRFPLLLPNPQWDRNGDYDGKGANYYLEGIESTSLKEIQYDVHRRFLHRHVTSMVQRQSIVENARD